ncbi:MAG: hypothetical protein FJ038_00245 [Chloroflexi bacterium]|nr:hypothetical protein [Chloroflexota bacterium]
MARRARAKGRNDRPRDPSWLEAAARLRSRRQRVQELLELEPPRGSGWLTAAPPADEVPVISVPVTQHEVAATAIPQPVALAAPAPARSWWPGRLGHLTGLDGLRAIAVVAVLLYHSDLDVMPGGFLGVDVFFVISGYLITALLLAEWARRGTIGLRRFWLRRARRLLPAVFFLLAGVMVFTLVALPDEVARLRSDAAAALAYVTNWYLVFHEQSYFESVGRPSPLGHLWSLAVEEQFYLLWPPALITLLVLFRRQGALLVTLLLAWLSGIWMAALFDPDVDPSRIYFGTDTRTLGLLVGAALAFVWVPDRAAMAAHAGATRRRLRGFAADAAAVASLALLCVLFLSLTAYDEFLYLGGLQFVALLSALIIALVVRPGGMVGRVLEWGPIRWLGVRSYSIYLWHWPVFVVTRPGIDVPFDGATALAIRLGVTLVLADVSYRFVERPIREGALGRTRSSWRSRDGRVGRSPRWSVVPAGLLVAILVAAIGAQVLAAPPAQMPSYLVGTEPASASEASGDDTTAADPDAIDDPELGSFDPGDPNVDPNLDVGADDPGLGDGSSDGGATDDPAADPADGGTTASAGDPAASGTDPFTPAATHEPATAQPTTGAASGPTAGFVPTAAPATQVLGPTPRAAPSGAAPSIDPDEPAATTPVADGSAAPPGLLPAAVATSGSTPKPSAQATSAPTSVARVQERVLAIGDSVMLGAVKEIRRQFASIEVNAAVSRQFNDGIRILRARLAAGTLPDIVVVHLGTNGPISKRQFDQAMATLKGVRLVVFVNVKVPRPWESYTNRTLSQNVARYPNAAMVDWHSESDEVVNAMARDGIHLNREGTQAYARLIVAAIT